MAGWFPLVTSSASTSTWNPADAAASLTLTSGNLDVFSTAGVKGSVRATHGQTTGKFYFEFTTPNDTAAFNLAVGIANSSHNLATDVAGSTTNSAMLYSPDGETFINNVAVGSSGAITTTGGVYAAIAVDLVSKRMWIGSSSYATGFWNNSASASPVTGVSSIDLSSLSFTGNIFPMGYIAAVTQANAEILANFGGSPYSYASTFATLQASGYSNW